MLDYVAKTIIETLKERNLDEGYIAGKTERLKDHDKYQSLDWAIQYLDPTSKHIFAKKLGVNVTDLEACGRVFNNI